MDFLDLASALAVILQRALGQRMLALIALFSLLQVLPVPSSAQAGATPTPQATPLVTLPNMPLYGLRENIHPNALIVWSNTWPQSGAAYRADYDPAFEYAGYFNPRKCYCYVTPGSYFRQDRETIANTFNCDTGPGYLFSGNFLNWASMTTLDIARYTLTGGKRIVDSATQTILQRALVESSRTEEAGYFARKEITKKDVANAVAPFGKNAIYILNCESQLYISRSTTYFGSCKNARLKDADVTAYDLKVQVCDDIDAAGRPDYCSRYGALFKPIGLIQKNALRMRFGLMSYLLDDAETRYGGVLRTAMKYVGEKSFSPPNFAPSLNTSGLEWDANGAFVANPDNAPEGRSGVINYINGFGETSYKSGDPLGELYYESLRYYQSLQPTTEAVSNAGGVSEGFPVLSSWADPVSISCQKNHIVLIGDANSQWDWFIPGNPSTNGRDGARAEVPEDGKRPLLNAKEEAIKIGKFESTEASKHGNTHPNNALSPLAGGAMGVISKKTSTGSYYVAGLARWAHVNPIRPDGSVGRLVTHVVDTDEGGTGIMQAPNRNVRPENSPLYLAAKYGGFNDVNADGNPFRTRGDNGATANSDLEWTTNPDLRPDNYSFATRPEQMRASLSRIFSSVDPYSGSLGGIVTNRDDVGAGLDTFVFQAGFDSVNWSGSLRKIGMSFDAGLNTTALSDTIQWDAGLKLTGDSQTPPNPLPENRKVFTVQPNNTGKPELVAFRWNLLTDAAVRTALNRNAAGTEDGRGQDRVDFLRGKRNLERGQPNGVFRTRERVLGDIVGSNIIFVGAPADNFSGTSYAAFATANAGRTKAVYVGANDGMLHAFRSSDGVELFAFIPPSLLRGLNLLTDPAYAHRPYADGKLVSGDALIGGNWRTVLAGGLGGGGQGVYALDVTNPVGFGQATDFLFDFTDRDDADMGNLMGPPQIARLQRSNAQGQKVSEFFLVVPSGFNNYADDGARSSEAGRNFLFFLRLDKQRGDAWSLGSNYFKVALPRGVEGEANALSTPTLVRDLNGVVRYAYVGDWQGRLYRLDFKDWTPGSGTASTPVTLLFAATENNPPSLGGRQSINTQPRVVFAPGGGYVVLFGTGRFLESAEMDSNGKYRRNSLYAVWDDLGAPATAGSALVTRNQLSVRQANLNADKSAVTIEGAAFTYGTTGGGARGWLLDFPGGDVDGEALTQEAVLKDGLLFFNTTTQSGNFCELPGARSYILNVLTGLPPATTTGVRSSVGVLSSPWVIQSGTTAMGAVKPTGIRTATRRNTVLAGYADGVRVMQGRNGDPVSVDLPAGRFSWREIVNWQALRRALSLE